jgi:hypothetical protein
MSKTYLVVVSQQLVQEVDGLVAHEALVFAGNEAVPGLLLESAQNIVVLRIELDFVLVEVVEQIVRSEDLGDLDELIRVAVAMEEGLFPKDHRRKHGTQTPHVQAVIVFLEINQQFGPLEIARGNSNVILGSGVVELGKTPIDKPQLR